MTNVSVITDRQQKPRHRPLCRPLCSVGRAGSRCRRLEPATEHYAGSFRPGGAPGAVGKLSILMGVISTNKGSNPNSNISMCCTSPRCLSLSYCFWSFCPSAFQRVNCFRNASAGEDRFREGDFREDRFRGDGFRFAFFMLRITRHCSLRQTLATKKPSQRGLLTRRLAAGACRWRSICLCGIRLRGTVGSGLADL